MTDNHHPEPLVDQAVLAAKSPTIKASRNATDLPLLLGLFVIGFSTGLAASNLLLLLRSQPEMANHPSIGPVIRATTLAAMLIMVSMSFIMWRRGWLSRSSILPNADVRIPLTGSVAGSKEGAEAP